MKDEALRLALEALEDVQEAYGNTSEWFKERVEAVRKALEQPEPEPVAWGVDWGKAGDSPCVSIIKRLPDGGIEVVAVEYGPKREPLTDEQIDALPFPPSGTATLRDFVRIIEAAHGIKE